jgi:hypothetical protein
LLCGGDALAAVSRTAPIPTNLGIDVNIVDLGADFIEPRTTSSPPPTTRRVRETQTR